MDILYELSRHFYWMAAVENSNSLTLWRTRQMSMMCQLPLKMLKAWEEKPEMGGHLRETTKRYEIVRWVLLVLQGKAGPRDLPGRYDEGGMCAGPWNKSWVFVRSSLLIPRATPQSRPFSTVFSFRGFPFSLVSCLSCPGLCLEMSPVSLLFVVRSLGCV